MCTIFDDDDIQKMILEGIESETEELSINSSCSEFTCQLFYVFRDCFDDKKTKDKISYVLSQVYGATLVEVSIDPQYECYVLGLNKIKSKREVSLFKSLLIALNSLCDMSLLANNGDEIICVLDVTKGCLTKDHTQKVSELLSTIPSTPATHTSEEIEQKLSEFNQLSNTFKDLMTRGYLKSNDSFETTGHNKEELTYIFGEFKKNHYCNICYIADARSIADTSELPLDVFSYESKSYITESNCGKDFIENKKSPNGYANFIPKRDILVFADENVALPNNTKKAVTTFLGEYQCKINNVDCSATFIRTSDKVDILSLKVDRLKTNNLKDGK